MSESPAETDRWKDWDAFLEETHETGFMQSSWWADFRAVTGFEYFGLALRDQGAVVGGAMVTKLWYSADSCFYYIQDGPVLPTEESAAGQIFEALLAAIDKRRQAEEQTITHLRIEPRWLQTPSFVRGFEAPTYFDNFMEPRDTLCIDLRPSEEKILAQMKPKGRYNIRVAQKHNVTVVQDTTEQGLIDFHRIYRRTALRQKIDVKPLNYFRTLAAMLQPNNQLELYFAEHDGRRLATALVIYFGARATYFYGGSLILRRRVMAPYLLHFEIMRSAKARSCEWYDFWGIAPASEPDHPWQDISVFKRKFGGVELNFIPTLDYVYDSDAYRQYVASERDQEAES